MEAYDAVMLHVLKTLFLGYGTYIGIVLTVLFIAFLFRKKIKFEKVRNVCLVIIGCMAFVLAFLSIPRIIDMSKDQYIVLENVTMSVDTMNEYDGSLMVFGFGKVKDKDGNSITLTGERFIDLPETDAGPHHEFRGTVVYGKCSKQIVDFDGYLIDE